MWIMSIIRNMTLARQKSGPTVHSITAVTIAKGKDTGRAQAVARCASLMAGAGFALDIGVVTT